MIVRIWRGWTNAEKADAYERFLCDQFLPAAHDIPGYLGARVLRRPLADEVEFIAMTHFESLEAIAAFAGVDLEKAHIAPEARALLSRWEDRAAHYTVAFDDLSC